MVRVTDRLDMTIAVDWDVKTSKKTNTLYLPSTMKVNSAGFQWSGKSQGKIEKKVKVREKSGNFELSQGNLKFWQKSGKSQGILESEVDRDQRNQGSRGINEKITKRL